MIVKLAPCYPLVVHGQIEKVSEMEYLLINLESYNIKLFRYDIIISLLVSNNEEVASPLIILL